ncbi:hypothetical protein [Jiangella anatolica]|uniref:Uncharacterized protein n=1 Tax=Jiangella anatolica TaxID=2670374 RepID=A0A2W2CYX1_9ACTN|nr:hypothetical protein [Jiangella anatolica]PZF85443.1 hypothetical protein C1I92_04845 [Jiangella anatolica]
MDEDGFRALARSSPWRWRSVELTRTLVGHSIVAEQAVRAWIDRPGRMRVVDHEGVEHLVDETPQLPADIALPLDPGAPAPVLRADGLVAERPSTVHVFYDDPMYENYLWVAMLDPVELSGGVDVLMVRDGVRAGRPTVEATVRPTSSYDPRCTCCAMLFGEVAAGLLRDEGGPQPDERAYADSFDVALDVETGICVRLRELGGDNDGAGFDVTIAAVTPA